MNATENSPTIRLSVPRAHQGRIVERSYGWHEGSLYLHVHDRSDGEIHWYRADDESAARIANTSYDPGGSDYAPDVDKWIACNEPKDSW